MIRTALPWLLSANTLTVMWLAGNRSRWAWRLGIIGQGGWFAFAVIFAAWGLVPLTLALTGVYARNLWRWRAPVDAQ